ncbi:MAG: hypothetical protein KJZ93_08770 [Caldilineaceae bacterium]|nr:hypothetical protein [Caldilineaceae bacterium]
MSSKFFNMSLAVGRIEQQHVRAALILGALILFVLGAGAPAVGGNG